MDKGYLPMDRPLISRANSSNPPQTNTTTNNTMPQNMSMPYPPPPSYTNDYLTPQSPTPSKVPPALPAFPASFSRSPSQPKVFVRSGSQERPAAPFPRADSGIEADYPRGPLSSTSTVNPRSSTIYESIDAGNVYTDPSPHNFAHHGRSGEGESHSSGVSSIPPATAYRTSPASDSEDGLDDNVGRCLNPMYNSLNVSSPQIYTEACHCKHQKRSSPTHLRYLWCGFLVLTVIAVLLLAVIAYVFFLLIPGIQSHIRIQKDEIKKMGSDYKTLAARVDALVWYPAGNVTTSKLQTSPAWSVADKLAELNDSVRVFQSQLQQLNTDLQMQISNISTTPGLQTLSGVASLKGCFRYKKTSIQALPGPASTTSWFPETGSSQLRDNMVMSVTCEVDGGTQHLVETQEVNRDMVQYRCRCDGRLDQSDRRKCQIHLLLCPRHLPVDLAGASP